MKVQLELSGSVEDIHTIIGIALDQNMLTSMVTTEEDEKITPTPPSSNGYINRKENVPPAFSPGERVRPHWNNKEYELTTDLRGTIKEIVNHGAMGNAYVITWDDGIERRRTAESQLLNA